MHHLAPGNTRDLRERHARPAAQQYDFMDESDSEDDDNARPQRGGAGGGRLRGVGVGGAANTAAPRDAATVVQDIRQAVSGSLRQSSNREWGLMEEVNNKEREREEREREREEAGMRSIRWGRLNFFLSQR